MFHLNFPCFKADICRFHWQSLILETIRKYRSIYLYVWVRYCLHGWLFHPWLSLYVVCLLKFHFVFVTVHFSMASFDSVITIKSEVLLLLTKEKNSRVGYISNGKVPKIPVCLGLLYIHWETACSYASMQCF